MNHQVNKKGLFITFEGGEGVGKSTQIKLLHQYCVQEGYPVVWTQEPGGTAFAKDIRNLFLAHKSLDIEEELLILLAARRHHIRHLIQPALDAGSIVLCDRYIDSSAVYQGVRLAHQADSKITSGLNQHPHFFSEEAVPHKILSPLILEWHEKAGINLWPDLTFVLLQNPETSRTRKALEEVNRFDQESLLFYENIQRRYETLADEENHRCIKIMTDDQSVQDIAYQIQKQFSSKLQD